MPSSTPYGQRILLFEDGRVKVDGIDFETSNITVVAKNENAVVLKVAGRTCWSGNYCPREYHPPQVMVYRVKKEKKTESGRVELTVEPLIEWDAGRKTKEKEGSKK